VVKNEEYLWSTSWLDRERKVLHNSLPNRKKDEKVFLKLPYTRLHPVLWVCHGKDRGGCLVLWKRMQMYKANAK